MRTFLKFRKKNCESVVKKPPLSLLVSTHLVRKVIQCAQENGGFSEVPTQMELTSSALAKQELQRTEQEMAEVA